MNINFTRKLRVTSFILSKFVTPQKLPKKIQG